MDQFKLPNNIVIPIEVLFCDNLEDNEKLLFGVLDNLTCFLNGYKINDYYLSKLINVHWRLISPMLTKLKRNGFINYTKSNGYYQITISRSYISRYESVLHKKCLELSNNVKKVEDVLKVEFVRTKHSNKQKPEFVHTKHNNTENQLKIKNLTIKERNAQYLPFAKKLSAIIQKNKNIKHTITQLRNWTTHFRLLVEDNNVSSDRIDQALDWYAQHINEPYVPVIESGASFREKFIKLENAISRDYDRKSKNDNYSRFRDIEEEKI